MNNEQKLLALINAHAAGKAVDMTKLWLLSIKIVGGFRSVLHGRLRSEKEDLVSDFVLGKIIVGKKTFPTFGALIIAYQNYLKDVLKHEKRSESIDEWETDDDGQSRICEIPDVGQSAEDVVHAKRMDAAAEIFVGSLSEGERAYLSESKVCLEDGEPVSVVAKRYHTTNYHAKARELGIYQHENSVTAADYAETAIGRWIEQELGIPLAVDRISEIRSAIVAMCRVAAMYASIGEQRSPKI